MIVRSFVFGLFAMMGMMFLVTHGGGPLLVGQAAKRVGHAYEAAGIDASACTKRTMPYGGQCLQQPMRNIMTRMAQPLPASDGDDLSNLPPGIAPH